jgi:hypothetical protein
MMQKSGAVFSNLSAPIERRHVSGLGTQFIASEMERLRCKWKPSK